MTAFLETTVDKFTFRVDPACYYNGEGVWVRIDGGRATIGLADYVQQRSGDIAFAEVKPEGTILVLGDFFCSIETIKIDISLSSPVTGKITRVNPALQSTPEIINQDPFGKGWLCEVDLSDWEKDRTLLMSAEAYFAKMKKEAEDEAKPK